MTEHYPCEQNAPLLLAEDVCSRCARMALELSMRRQEATLPVRLDRAWYVAEMALVTARPRDRRKSLRYTNRLLGGVIAQAENPLILAGAKALKASLPAFVDRANEVAISDISKRHANEGFGEVLSNSIVVPAADKANWAAESLALYLMSRQNMTCEDFLLPSSPRERDAIGELQRFNHDVYSITADGMAKFPLRLGEIEDNGVYDVPMLRMTSTLRPVMDKMGSESLEPLIAMAASESIDTCRASETATLDFAGHCLQDAIQTLRYDYNSGMSGLSL